jgi:hypothetical protein
MVRYIHDHRQHIVAHGQIHHHDHGHDHDVICLVHVVGHVRVNLTSLSTASRNHDW